MTMPTIVQSILRRKIDTALEISIAVLFVGAMAFGGFSIAAHAQTSDTTQYVMPVVPDEAGKLAAMKRAWELNGYNMVGWGMIDLTQDRTAEPWPPAAKAIAKTKTKRP